MSKAWFPWALLLVALGVNSCAKDSQPDQAVSLAGAGGPPQVQPQRVALVNGHLWLEGCVVKYESQGRTFSLPTALSQPCVLSVDFQGGPAVIRTNWGDALLVVRSKEKGTRESASDPKECDTVVQGVLVASERLLLSPPMESFAACGAGPFDKKLYEVLAAQAYERAQFKPRQ